MDEGTFSYLDIDNNFSPILEIAQLSEGALGMFDMTEEASRIGMEKTYYGFRRNT